MKNTFAFVRRIPASCTHDKNVYEEVYLVDNPNKLPHPEEAIIRGTPGGRAMMRVKGTERDITDRNPTGSEDDWPDFYYVTRCNACDSERIGEWNMLHWDRDPDTRTWKLVRTLAAFDANNPLSPEDETAILDMIRYYHLTKGDFWRIDEKPGHFGYQIEGREWHWKLRQVRNRAGNALFNVLDANEAEGYTDTDNVPEIPLWFLNQE